MLRWLVYSTHATLLAGEPSSTTYLFIHTLKTSRLYQNNIQCRNQPKPHKIRFDTTTQYHQENKTVFTSTKLT